MWLFIIEMNWSSGGLPFGYMLIFLRVRYSFIFCCSKRSSIILIHILISESFIKRVNELFDVYCGSPSILLKLTYYMFLSDFSLESIVRDIILY